MGTDGKLASMAGYSGTPLAKKLGIKPGHRVVLADPPGAFEIEGLPEGVTLARSLRGTAAIEVAAVFVKTVAVLERRFSQVQARLAIAGGLWVAWPKKSSGVATELSDSAVRAHGLDAGLVDNKVCAIDETWSGLRFVRRVRDC
ncbi:MAG: hypothetical protein DHS20C14_13990 [Phycisphaeraceae bacterium]|nr:MAG: hypothetical protein DHS20C14_13990 [Phycisphaeraceae bacterium]